MKHSLYCTSLMSVELMYFTYFPRTLLQIHTKSVLRYFYSNSRNTIFRNSSDSRNIEAVLAVHF